MSHKVHPKAYRIKRINDWAVRGYYKNPAEYLKEDFRIKEFLNKKIGKFAVEKIEMERYSDKLNIIIFSARPGLIIGRKGEEIERLKKELENKILKKPASGRASRKNKKEIKIEIKEVRDFWSSASLSAQWAAQQIEKRIPYRRVLKQTLSKIIFNKEVKGARVEVAGRLNGVEMARTQWVSEGRLPRQNIRADIDYAKVEAHCSYGAIGIKVWIYKGDKFDK